MLENEISALIVDVAYRVHKQLGPGLLETVYEAAMAYEFDQIGLAYQRQLVCPVPYRGIVLTDIGFRMDFLVASKVILEIKSVEKIAPVHPKIVLTYLKLSEKKLALMINFNVALIKDGIQRIVNGL
jgi:GxxExxY protein